MKNLIRGSWLIMACAMLGHAEKGSAMNTFDFLNLPEGAHQTGIGGSSMGMIGDPYAIFSNPAGLQISTTKIGFTYTSYPAGIQGGSMLYVLPRIWQGTFGAGISYLNYGEIPETDERGVESGTFTPQSSQSVLCYATSIGNSRIGVNTKIIYSAIQDYTSWAIAGGVAFLFYPKQWEPLVIGGTIQNLGLQLVEFDKEKESLPTFARLGVSYFLFNKLVQASAELHLPERNFILGVEWIPSSLLTLRCGYYSWGKELEVGDALDIFAGKTFGLAVKTERLLLDYAIAPKVELGLVHSISITYLFLEKPPPQEEKPEPEKIYFEEPPDEQK